MEITGSKPPRRIGYKETTVIWLNSNCQVMSNRDVPVNDGIDKALRFIQNRLYMQMLEGIMNEYIKKAPDAEASKGKGKILTR